MHHRLAASWHSRLDAVRADLPAGVQNEHLGSLAGNLGKTS
jgi:hypothetical protein